METTTTTAAITLLLLQAAGMCEHLGVVAQAKKPIIPADDREGDELVVVVIVILACSIHKVTKSPIPSKWWLQKHHRENLSSFGSLNRMPICVNSSSSWKEFSEIKSTEGGSWMTMMMPTALLS